MNLFISNFRRIIALIVTCILLTTIFYGLIKPQFNNSIPDHPTEAWISDVALMREALYKNKPAKPSIFIVSGSNSLFGINSKIIEDKTQFNVKNYAIHAGLHMDLMFSQIRKKVKAGDIVIAPLEWEVLSHTSIRQFDYENYLHHFNNAVTPTAKLQYDIFSSVPLKRWTDGFKAYIFQRYDRERYTDYTTINGLEKTWRTSQDIPDKQIYSYLSLTEFGDINVLAPMTQKTWEKESTLSIPEHLNKEGLEKLAQWQIYFEKIGAKFIWTYPLMLDGVGGIDSLKMWERIKLIRDQMAATNHPLYCDPIKATFSSIYRFDTANHANAEGARIRSRDLASCLEQIIKGEDARTQPFEAETAITSVKERLSLQKNNFGEGNMPFQLYLRNVTEINEAIKIYFQKNGSFPRSTNPGDWGLPANINVPVITDPQNMYKIIYWSNESGYKLIVKAPSTDCPVVFANWRDMIDMTNTTNNDPMTCTAYGYWSDDQKSR